MLKRLLQTIFNFPAPGSEPCACCNRKHSLAKPFIEGETGVLICYECIVRTAAQQNNHIEPEAQNFESTAESKNPYQTPKTINDQTNCEFCHNETVRAKLFVFGKSHRICYDCIQYSIELIENHTAKRGIPNG